MNIIVAILMFLFSCHVLAEVSTYEDGMTAFNKSDYKTASLIFKPLAENGHADSQYHLGLLCFYGNGVEENDSEAIKWFGKAADNGQKEAQYRIGLIYDPNVGGAQDRAQADHWLGMSCESGYEPACIRMIRAPKQDGPGH